MKREQATQSKHSSRARLRTRPSLVVPFPSNAEMAAVAAPPAPAVLRVLLSCITWHSREKRPAMPEARGRVCELSSHRAKSIRTLRTFFADSGSTGAQKSQKAHGCRGHDHAERICGRSIYRETCAYHVDSSTVWRRCSDVQRVKHRKRTGYERALNA
jgi:hypothetical protein